MYFFNVIQHLLHADFIFIGSIFFKITFLTQNYNNNFEKFKKTTKKYVEKFISLNSNMCVINKQLVCKQAFYKHICLNFSGASFEELFSLGTIEPLFRKLFFFIS